MRRLALLVVPLVACTSAEPKPERSQPADPPASAAAQPEVAPTSQPVPGGEDQDEGLEGPWTLEVRAVSGPMFRYQFIANHMGSFWWVQAVGDDLRLLEGKMTRDELSNLQRAMSSEFFELDERYVEEGVYDGSQVTMRLTHGGRSHRVVADNQTPRAMAAIEGRVSEVMTPERRAALADAPAAQPEDLDPTLVY